MLNVDIHQESMEKAQFINDHKNLFMHFLNTLDADLIYKHICTSYSSSSKHFVILLK